MNDEPLQEARTRLGVSLRRLGDEAGCSAASVLDKLNGRFPWKLDEARKVTAFLKTLDPEVSMDALFPVDTAA